MIKTSPGARLGIAVASDGDVKSIPFNVKDWNNVTLIQTIQNKKDIKNKNKYNIRSPCEWYQKQLNE